MRWVYTISFAPDGNTLASGSADGKVRIWQLIDPEYKKSLINNAIEKIRFSIEKKEEADINKSKKI